MRCACHGGGPKDRFTQTTAGQNGLNYLCAGYFSFFGAAQPGIDAMATLLQNNRPPANIMKPAWRARLARQRHPEDTCPT